MKNLTGLWPNLFRAIEVAKTGNHSLSVHYVGDYTEAQDDYKAIKDYCKNWFTNFVPNGQIKIEIIKPGTYVPKTKFESLEDIDTRIKKALLMEKPKLILDNANLSFIKTATNRLNLSYTQINNIKKIAVTIARLELSGITEMVHIAESVQYSFINTEDYHIYNAESNNIQFGDNIIINKAPVNEKEIKEAIKYLNNLLK